MVTTKKEEKVTALSTFINKKKADSPYVRLNDGEKVQMKVKEIKTMMKTGFGGAGEVEVIRVTGIVKTDFGDKEKTWDNGTLRVAEALQSQSVVAGDIITITRRGTGPKTVYEVVKDNAVPF